MDFGQRGQRFILLDLKLSNRMNAKNSKLLILPKQKVKMLGLFYNRIDNLQNIMFVVFR